MPTVLKKGEIAIKDRTTGEYTKYVNVVAEQTTEDMIEDIQQEGTTQIAAIEAKGEETLNSIPDDYTELDGKIDDLGSLVGITDITWSPGIVTRVSNGDVIDLSNIKSGTESTHKHTLISVEPNTTYIITASDGSSTRRLLFDLAADYVVNAQSLATDATLNHIAYTTTPSTAYLLINTSNSGYSSVFRKVSNETIDNRVVALENKLTIIENKIVSPELFDVSQSKNIILLGDSITQGFGSSDFIDNGDPLGFNYPGTDTPVRRNTGIKCWASKFTSLMYNEYGCSVVNNGVGGIRADQLYSRINPEDSAYISLMLPQNTDYCLLMIGTNDRNQSLDSYYTDLTNLIETIQENNTVPFVFSVIPLNGASSNVTMGKMQIVARQVCSEKNVLFCDMYSKFSAFQESHENSLSYYFDDQLHPNDIGHSLIFAIIRDFLKV